jgi:hypothetical protein
MIFDGKLVIQVESGTAITNPESGERFPVMIAMGRCNAPSYMSQPIASRCLAI